MTSVERVMAYTKIDSEIGYNTSAPPPGSWPSEGRLDLQNLSLVYFDGGPRVLKGINVCISSKEKVGVVGRTGAGKSSLVSALFRMPDPLGKVGKTDVCEYKCKTMFKGPCVSEQKLFTFVQPCICNERRKESPNL